MSEDDVKEVNGALYIKPYAYRINDAAKYLGVTIYHIRRAIWDGILPARKLGRTVVLRSDLDEYAKQNKIVAPLNTDWIRLEREKKAG